MSRIKVVERVDAYQEKILHLEQALDDSRRTILGLMPDPFRDILRSYTSCQSRQESYGWERSVAEQIADLAKPLSVGTSSYLSDRAYCPLCGEGSSSPYEKGFSLPEGLRRHLVGWGGHGEQCSVMEAAAALASTHWHMQFHEAEEAARAEAEARTAQRRKVETLFRTAPDVDPVLIDEGILFLWEKARDINELTWAEERLADLGFQINQQANVKSYVRTYEKFAVYADPRMKGHIEFAVFKRPLPRRGRTSSRPAFLARNNFRLMDSWKNNVRGKYEARLEQVVARLMK